MPVRGPGGGTSFEGMSHEQMLAWLDRADAGQVQAAAGRLTAAAKAIREIAEELKVRPQWVAWKGEGANAFRTWSADLANSTLRLGDFSEDAAKWLTEASGAIAQAQASIPRETGGGGRASDSSDTATAPTPEAAAAGRTQGTGPRGGGGPDAEADADVCVVGDAAERTGEAQAAASAGCDRASRR